MSSAAAAVTAAPATARLNQSPTLPRKLSTSWCRFRTAPSTDSETDSTTWADERVEVAALAKAPSAATILLVSCAALPTLAEISEVAELC